MKKYNLLAGVSALALVVAGCADRAPENVTTENTVIVEDDVTENVVTNDVDDETPVNVENIS